MSQTPNDKMEKIFELMCDSFIKKLESDEGLSASELKSLLEFLKDNGITVSGLKNSKLSNIVDKLPFADDEAPSLTVIKN